MSPVCFHILPTLVQGEVSPGVYTAALLYLPFSTWALVGASRDGVPRATIATAFVAGTAMMVGVVLIARLGYPAGWLEEDHALGGPDRHRFAGGIRSEPVAPHCTRTRPPPFWRQIQAVRPIPILPATLSCASGPGSAVALSWLRKAEKPRSLHQRCARSHQKQDPC